MPVLDLKSTSVQMRGKTEKYYFSSIGLTLLVLVLLGFSDNLFTDVGQESNSIPLFVVHGLFCLGWIVIFAVQTMLIKTQNYRTHMKVGLAGAFFGMGALLSTLFIYYTKFVEEGDLLWLSRVNLTFILSYGVCVFLGLRNRTMPNRHKRYMLIATLFMMGPVLDRVAGHLGINPFILVPTVWISLFASAMIYDRMTVGKVHAIVKVGTVWFFVVWILVAAASL